MAQKKFSFNKPINSSVQVGDKAWYSVLTSGIVHGEPQILGDIVAIENNNITVEISSATNVSVGDFFLFSKPIEVNESSMKGYYADVTLKNLSNKYAELFAISSEIVPSSK